MKGSRGAQWTPDKLGCILARALTPQLTDEKLRLLVDALRVVVDAAEEGDLFLLQHVADKRQARRQRVAGDLAHTVAVTLSRLLSCRRTGASFCSTGPGVRISKGG